MHFILSLILLLHSFGSFGGQEPASQRCIREIEAVGRSLIWEGINHLTLPPHSKRFLIGVLVHSDKDGYVLAVGGYRTRHAHLMTALEILESEEDLSSFQILWMGELLAENGGNQTALGRIAKANEVSGLWNARYKEDSRHTNNVNQLGKILREHAPRLLRKKFESIRWKDSRDEEKTRLMGKANKYVAAFDALVAEGSVPPEETYRHFIGNQVSMVVHALPHILDGDSFPGTQAERLEALHALFDPPLSFASLYLYVHWLHNDGFLEVIPLKRILKKLKKHGQLSWQGWQEMADAAHSFLELAGEVNNPTRFVAEAQVLRLDRLEFDAARP